MCPELIAPVTLARILRPWGRRGEVAAEILTDFPQRLAEMREAWLAGERRGLEVQVPLEERAQVGLGRYYITDLIGCQVWEEGAAAALGVVQDVQRAGEEKRNAPPESWILVVSVPAGELLIPLAAEICTLIDTASRRIEVRLPEGLRELNAG